jgi:cation diffusion facilitator family transporter
MRKKRAALVSVASNTSLVIIKLIAGLVSGSISIISEALHSLMDLVASVIAYISVKQAAQPADEEHPFGHGKAENLSGLFEAILLIIAAGIIIYESLRRIFYDGDIRHPSFALIVMGISAVVNMIVSRYLNKVARETDSLALEADAKHLSADVYTSMGVFIGLLIVTQTGISIFDPLVAIIIAFYIAYEGIMISKKSIYGLMDVRLPDREEQLIREVLDRHKEELKNYHDLRTRKSGSERHVDFHAVLCKNSDISEIHDLMDKIEDDLQKIFPDTKVLIHPEPCDHHDEDKCPSHCYWIETIKKDK